MSNEQHPNAASGLVPSWRCYSSEVVPDPHGYRTRRCSPETEEDFISFSWYIVDLVDVKVLFAYYDDASYLLINGTKIFLRACAGFQIHPT